MTKARNKGVRARPPPQVFGRTTTAMHDIEYTRLPASRGESPIALSGSGYTGN